MLKFIKNIPLLLFIGFLLTFPFNLFYTLLPQYGYVHGLQIDYLLPKFYLVDFFLIPLAIVGWASFIQSYRRKKSKGVLLSGACLLGYLFITQFQTVFPFTGIWFFAQIVKILGLGFFLWKNQALFHTKVVRFALFITFLFQFLIVSIQFYNQHSVFPYQILGETQIQSQIGIDKINFAFIDNVVGTHVGLRLIPYGTFPHPNVLAGFFVTVCLTLLLTLKNSWMKFLVITATVIIILLTQSLSALGTFLIGLFYLLLKDKVRFNSQKLLSILISIFIFIPLSLYLFPSSFHNPSIIRRQNLNNASTHMIQENILFGVGLNQFTAHVENYQSRTEIVRFAQPAHHVPLLLLSEVGLIGVLLLAILLWNMWKENKKISQQLLFTLFILSPILAWDHYLYTLQQGGIIFVLTFCILLGNIRKSKSEKSV